MKTMKIMMIGCSLLSLSACMSAPSRPYSLWDEMPSTEEGRAKTVPSKILEPTTPEEGESGGDAPVSEVIPGTVVLNEIFYDATESDTDGHLFIELYGTPGMTLGGFKVSFVNGSDGKLYDTITLPVEAAMPVDGFYVIADAKTGESTASNVADADLIDNFDPQNGPDAVQLLDASGVLLDAVGYGEGSMAVAENGLSSFEGAPAVDAVSGQSLERRETGVDTGDNAQDFVAIESPTPGSQHATASTPDPLPNPDPIPDPTPDPAPETTPVGSTGGEIPSESPQKVVLNEIYYDAVGSDSDGVLFIELYGDAAMALEGYQINFVDGADGSIDDTITLPSGAQLGGDGFFVIADAKTGLPNETFVVGADFIDNFDPANGPDAVQLLDAQGSLRDAVGYGEGLMGKAQNGLDAFEGSPTFDVLNGHSLERKSPGEDFDDNLSDFVERELPTPGTGFPM